ncbi:MAG: hypothetical protein ACLUR9_07620 [Christensenellales bacterium]
MKQKKSYQDSIHTAGRIWMLTALVLLVLVPTFICIHYKAWPGFGPVFKGLLGVAPIFLDRRHHRSVHLRAHAGGRAAPIWALSPAI